MTRRISFIFISFFLFFSQKQNLISQYRDPLSENLFSEKTKGINIKKRNKIISKKTKNFFSSVKNNNGIYGLDQDPFKFNKKNIYIPTGIDEDSFTKEHRRMAYSYKYNKRVLKKKALKSRKKHFKKMK